MATLISVQELALWTSTTIAADDPKALLVLELASGLVCDTAEHPEWEVDVVPPRAARRICFQVAGRTWTNPDLEVAWGIGPLSGRNLDWAAYGLTLTPAEEEELEDLQGGPDDGINGLWILGVVPEPTVDPIVYVNDQYGQQTIPYLDPRELDAMTPEEL